MRHTLSGFFLLVVPLLTVLAAGDERTSFHPDPDHLWNRLHRHLYVQTPTAGVDNQERLEPFAASESPFLVKGASPRQAIALLDEFLRKKAEQPIRDPLKRAILQHDLWSVLLATTGPAHKEVFEDDGRVLTTERFVDRGDVHLGRTRERREFQKRLVQAMKQLALSDAEIKALPDNLRAAVQAGGYAKEFDPKEPDRPFLPADLLAKDSPWVVVASATRLDGLGAPAHLAANKGRSVFTVLLRLPGERKGTEAFVRQLKDGKLPDLPEGAQTALLRRMLLIDDQGQLRPVPLTESLQVRVYWKDDLGRPSAFRLRRSELFAGRAGGLQPISLKEHNCQSCHARLEGGGVRSIASLYGGHRTRPGLQVSDAAEQTQQTLDWVVKTYSWGLLQGLWETETPR